MSTALTLESVQRFAPLLAAFSSRTLTPELVVMGLNALNVPIDTGKIARLWPLLSAAAKRTGSLYDLLADPDMLREVNLLLANDTQPTVCQYKCPRCQQLTTISIPSQTDPVARLAYFNTLLRPHEGRDLRNDVMLAVFSLMGVSIDPAKLNPLVEELKALSYEGSLADLFKREDVQTKLRQITTLHGVGVESQVTVTCKHCRNMFIRDAVVPMDVNYADHVGDDPGVQQ